MAFTDFGKSLLSSSSIFCFPSLLSCQNNMSSPYNLLWVLFLRNFPPCLFWLTSVAVSSSSLMFSVATVTPTSAFSLQILCYSATEVSFVPFLHLLFSLFTLSLSSHARIYNSYFHVLVCSPSPPAISGQFICHIFLLFACQFLIGCWSPWTTVHVLLSTGFYGIFP